MVTDHPPGFADVLPVVARLNRVSPSPGGAVASRPPVFVPALERQSLHRHREARAILFLAGEMMEEGFDGRARFLPGDVLVRSAHVAHADIAGPDGGAYIRLDLPESILAKVTAQRGWRSARVTADLGRAWHVEDLFALVEPVEFEPTVPTSLECRAAAQLAREPGVRVQRVAGALGLRAFELTRRFVTRFGVTPNRYRRYARLDRAVQLLVGTARPLADIAQDVGYHDQAHMAHDVLRELGSTPSALRVAARTYKT